MSAGVSFYFGKDIERLTLSQIRDCQAFLANRNGGAANGAGAGDAIASAAASMMAKGDRKEIPLSEVIGYV